MIGETREKRPVEINLIIIKNGGNEQIAYYAPKIHQFFSCYDDGMTLHLQHIFFTLILLKTDEQRFLYIDPCERSNS